MTGLREPDWYNILTEFNSSGNTYLSDQYSQFWDRRDEDELDELKERYSEQYINRRSASQYRKNALTTVMGAFFTRHGDNGRIYEETGWAFQELNPFKRDDSASADILLAKPTEGETILVILLPERESPESVVEQSVRGIKAVRENPSRFEYQAAPDKVHGAIVVNPPRDEIARRAVDSEGGDCVGDIFIWRVYDIDKQSETDDDSIEERKIIDYYAALDDELNSVGPNMRLLDVLEEGVEINQSREILPDFFIESHHSIFLDHSVGHIVQKRKRDDDGALTHFSRSEIVQFIEDTLFEQNVSDQAADKADFLLAMWNQMGTVKPIKGSRNDIEGSTFYRFTVHGGMNQNDIIRAVKDRYPSQSVEFYIQIDAMREALNAYRDKFGEQATLATNYSS